MELARSPELAEYRTLSATVSLQNDTFSRSSEVSEEDFKMLLDKSISSINFTITLRLNLKFLFSEMMSICEYELKISLDDHGAFALSPDYHSIEIWSSQPIRIQKLTIRKKTAPRVAFWVDRTVGLKFSVFLWESEAKIYLKI